ncbi:DUF1206 domain-containing protein [Nocardioides sp. YIM 152588]|uniref:DUF1206 domain-containing protein n=1 Tax=Nocardioides sp. YIM 152588 TaxID=3158259 RepID=UPI0032E3D056
MGDIGEQAHTVGRRAQDSEWLERAARFGLLTYGLVHLTIGWLAIQLAFGDRSGSSDSTGALRALATQPFGAVVVWLVAIGMFLLTAWRLLEAAVGDPEKDGASDVAYRLKAVGRAAIFGYLGWGAVRIALDEGGSGGGTDSFTARVMDAPAGQLLVGAIGVGIIGYGGHLVWKGCTDGFTDDLSPEATSGRAGTAYTWIGRVGHVAKGVALGIVGVLFVNAAAQHQPKKSGGLDQALREVLDQPFGPFLLCLIGAGIACYGAFALIRARHLDQ